MFPVDDVLSYYIYRALRMIEKYNPHKIHFLSWLNKLEFVADYLNVPYHRMVPFLCLMLKSHVIGNLTRRLYPRSPFLLSYPELISALCKFYAYITPYYNDYVARLRFIEREQYKNETIEKYSKCLLRLHSECNYLVQKDRKLCDQFKRGLRNQKISTILNQIPYLKFKAAVKIAIDIENLEQELKDTLKKKNSNNSEPETVKQDEQI
ncbi:hypothetical protein M0804_013300 [Polistes exclamans]|nr:hypothetical protein M0804_013300 [Polistes exclamans]